MAIFPIPVCVIRELPSAFDPVNRGIAFAAPVPEMPPDPPPLALSVHERTPLELVVSTLSLPKPDEGHV